MAMLRVTCSAPDPKEQERREALKQLFGRYMPKGMPVTNTWVPVMDVTARDSTLTIRCDLPGVEPSDIQVSTMDRTVTISGERKAPAPSDDEWVRDITYGRFSRTFTLPQAIEASAVKAEYRHGILEMQCPLRTGN